LRLLFKQVEKGQGRPVAFRPDQASLQCVRRHVESISQLAPRKAALLRERVHPVFQQHV
jgi:hypothetical protein